jgi:hypothetical protein
MFKDVKPNLWAFDMEWVPDTVGGRALYHLPPETTDRETMQVMWRNNGATEEEPQPFIKTALCRVISIAMVDRTRDRTGKVQLRLRTLPQDTSDDGKIREAYIVGTFLGYLGKFKPQLVGYNSIAADIRALVQRGMICGLHCPEFGRRPNKPWEGPDYFSRISDWNIDLKDALTPGWGSGSPSLNEMATLSGIPGKMEMDGQAVPPMWLDGHLDKIVAYNEYDALTTYLVWLRTAHFAGFFTPVEYDREQQMVRDLIQQEIAENRPHLQAFLDEWDRLKTLLER